MIKSSLTPPTVDQATIDYYVARGKRARSEAFVELFRAIFAKPEPREAPAAQLLRNKLDAAA